MSMQMISFLVLISLIVLMYGCTIKLIKDYKEVQKETEQEGYKHKDNLDLTNKQ
jgi:ATP/ADP translocase